MKALAKLLADFVAWRWAPTVAILTASLFYVLVVVGLVPTEIDVPMTNPRFHPKPVSTSSNEATIVPAMENTPAAAPVPLARTQPIDFGRRGFSPPLARPDPPPAPPPPPPPPPPVVAPPEPVVVPPPEPVAQEPVTAPPDPPAAPVGPRGPRNLPGVPRNMTGLLQNVTRALHPITGTDPAAPPVAPPAPPGSAAPDAPAPPQ